MAWNGFSVCYRSRKDSGDGILYWAPNLFFMSCWNCSDLENQTKLAFADLTLRKGTRMKNRTWIRVIGFVLLAVAPVVAQQPQPAGRLPMAIVPLREPHFVPAAKADFLKNEDRGLGVRENGAAKPNP